MDLVFYRVASPSSTVYENFVFDVFALTWNRQVLWHENMKCNHVFPTKMWLGMPHFFPGNQIGDCHVHVHFLCFLCLNFDLSQNRYRHSSREQNIRKYMCKDVCNQINVFHYIDSTIHKLPQHNQWYNKWTPIFNIAHYIIKVFCQAMLTYSSKCTLFLNYFIWKYNVKSSGSHCKITFNINPIHWCIKVRIWEKSMMYSTVKWGNFGHFLRLHVGCNIYVTLWQKWVAAYHRPYHILQHFRTKI